MRTVGTPLAGSVTASTWARIGAPGTRSPGPPDTFCAPATAATSMGRTAPTRAATRQRRISDTSSGRQAPLSTRRRTRAAILLRPDGSLGANEDDAEPDVIGAALGLVAEAKGRTAEHGRIVP